MAWVQANWALIATVLWGVCETLSLIPAIKSNSVFTLIYNSLKALNAPKAP